MHEHDSRGLQWPGATGGWWPGARGAVRQRLQLVSACDKPMTTDWLWATNSDENRRKQTGKSHLYFRFYIFLAETGSSSENTGTETGSGYAEVRKRTNTDVEPERITRSNILEYTLTKSQNNIHVRTLLEN